MYHKTSIHFNTVSFNIYFFKHLLPKNLALRLRSAYYGRSTAHVSGRSSSRSAGIFGLELREGKAAAGCRNLSPAATTGGPAGPEAEPAEAETWASWRGCGGSGSSSG